MISPKQELQLDMFCTLERLGFCSVMIVGNFATGEIEIYDIFEWSAPWEA